MHGREARLLADPNFGVRTIPVTEYKQQVQQYLGRAISLVKLENAKGQAQNALRFNEHRLTPSFETGELVLVDFPVQSVGAAGRAVKLSRHWRGPFRVARKISTDRFDVQDLETNKLWNNVHANRMKKYVQANEGIASLSAPGCRDRMSSPLDNIFTDCQSNGKIILEQDGKFIGNL